MKMYKYLAEHLDRRSKEYKSLDKQLDELVLKYGKGSKEVEDFFNLEVDILPPNCGMLGLSQEDIDYFNL
jgi:hypothetical protein